ncbi:ATP-binding protein [Amycolatopsis saalfeldensis]|uniref:ATP-binding protein n=1 Tax=Amycolatopsis saalfeldensis TaxID=394193 RepID=UPI000B89BDDC
MSGRGIGGGRHRRAACSTSSRRSGTASSRSWSPDDGAGNPPEDTHGRGLLLIRSLADTSECPRRPDGTTVTMRRNTARDQ